MPGGERSIRQCRPDGLMRAAAGAARRAPIPAAARNAMAGCGASCTGRRSGRPWPPHSSHLEQLFMHLRIFAVPALVLAGTAGALAADPAPRLYDTTSSYAAPPTFTWSGAYIGVNGGYRRASFGRGARSEGGFTGGVHAGYLTQLGLFALGGELEAAYLGGKSGSGPALGGARIDQSWMLAAKLRAGVAVGRLLVFTTAGYARSNIDVKDGHTRDGWRGGYLLGGGVEYAMTDRLALRAEYDFVRYGGQKIVLGDGARVKGDLTNHLVRAGVSYRF